MTDIRNIELKLVNKIVSSNASLITGIGGQVPSGMKRWVTFVSVDTLVTAGGASNIGIYFASVAASSRTKSSIVATGNRKMLLMLRATQSSGLRKTPFQVPKKSNVNCPLFSIAGGNWLLVYATKATGMLKVQYFDE